MNDNLPQCIADKIWPEPNSGCWLWGGCVAKNGYGRLTHRRVSQYAHRFVYEAVAGAIPPGLQLDHLCRNRACVNPRHLEPVTRRENILRGESLPAKFARAETAICGHPFDGKKSNGGRWCTSCQRAKVRAYNDRSRERKNELQRAYVERHREQVNARKRERAHAVAS